MGRVEYFEGLVVGSTMSYHAEVLPAPDTYIGEAALRMHRDGREISEHASTDPHRFRPHMRVSGYTRADRAALSLIVYAHREELVLPVFFSSTLIAGVLSQVPGRAESLDGQTLAALLLSPFALSAFYIRSAENGYVTRMLLGVRFVAFLPIAAGLAVIAAVALGGLGGEPGTATQLGVDVARAGFLVAAISSLLLVPPVSIPTFAQRVRPRLRASIERSRQKAHDAEERRIARVARWRRLGCGSAAQRAQARSLPTVRASLGYYAVGAAGIVVLLAVLVAAVLLARFWWNSSVPSSIGPMLTPV